MKICTYSRSTPLGEVSRLGIFFNESTIIDVNTVWESYFEDKGYFLTEEMANHQAPSSLSSFLKIYQDQAIEKLLVTLEHFTSFSTRGILTTKNGKPLSFDLKDDKSSKLKCPIDNINLYRDFYVHEKHVATGFAKRNEPIPAPWYEMPAYYKGSTSGFIGDGDIIPWPSYTKKLDYELELGVVIAKDGFNISEKQAHKHIFGFTIFNDVSARDIQKKEMAVRLGPAKGKDFCSVVGPVIVTADEFNGKDPNLLMTAQINDQEWSRGYSGEANFSWSQMIAHASMDEWVLSTDFMGSGTVGTGCGLEIDKWIQPGDKVILEIEKIGKLSNIIGTPSTKG